MKVIKLVGKLAIRKKPVCYGIDDMTGEKIEDYSYTTEPLRIIKVTKNHIICDYTGTDTINEKIFNDKPKILDSRWLDNNWTDYEKLIKIDQKKGD